MGVGAAEEPDLLLPLGRGAVLRRTRQPQAVLSVGHPEGVAGVQDGDLVAPGQVAVSQRGVLLEHPTAGLDGNARAHDDEGFEAELAQGELGAGHGHRGRYEQDDQDPLEVQGAADPVARSDDPDPGQDQQQLDDHDPDPEGHRVQGPPGGEEGRDHPLVERQTQEDQEPAERLQQAVPRFLAIHGRWFGPFSDAVRGGRIDRAARRSPVGSCNRRRGGPRRESGIRGATARGGARPLGRWGARGMPGGQSARARVPAVPRRYRTRLRISPARASATIRLPSGERCTQLTRQSRRSSSASMTSA